MIYGEMCVSRGERVRVESGGHEKERVRGRVKEK
jgi:hypothetical protein